MFPLVTLVSSSKTCPEIYLFKSPKTKDVSCLTEAYEEKPSDEKQIFHL